MISRIRRHYFHVPATGLLLAMLGGCLEAEKEALSYTAINRTDSDIVAIAVNGEGGVLHASAQNGGGQPSVVSSFQKNGSQVWQQKSRGKKAGYLSEMNLAMLSKNAAFLLLSSPPGKKKL